VERSFPNVFLLKARDPATASIALEARFDYSLSFARAQSTGGFDAICDAVEESLVPGTGSAPSKESVTAGY
jgi:hypothetical protein